MGNRIISNLDMDIDAVSTWKEVESAEVFDSSGVFAKGGIYDDEIFGTMWHKLIASYSGVGDFVPSTTLCMMGKITLARPLKCINDPAKIDNEHWPLMTVMAVLPPEYRPIMTTADGEIRESPLGKMYRDVIRYNNILKELIASSNDTNIIDQATMRLQRAVNDVGREIMRLRDESGLRSPSTLQYNCALWPKGIKENKEELIDIIDRCASLASELLRQGRVIESNKIAWQGVILGVEAKPSFGMDDVRIRKASHACVAIAKIAYNRQLSESRRRRQA